MSWPGYGRLDLAAIAIGGLAGATLRWLINPRGPVDGGWFAYEPNSSVTLQPGLELSFPGHTLAANLLGCLLLGALTVLLTRQLPIPRRLLIGAATGFCGSLTTFSTFAVEVAERLRGLPAATSTAGINPLAYGPERGAALTYLVVSVIGGALVFWFGRTIARRIVTSPGDVTIGGVQ